jgi:hypothetical protein
MIVSETVSASGLSFIMFTVLPVAFRELLHWLYEWQILICGVLALVAARVWGRSVVRAARITARAKAQPVEIRRPPAEPVVVPTPLAAVTEPVVKVPPPRADMTDLLFSLREQIRNTLGRMPCTDDVLNAERLDDCRSIAEFPLGDPPADAGRAQIARFEALKSKLAALKDVRETDTCRNAWEALVRISMDARDLMGDEPAKVAGHSS